MKTIRVAAIQSKLEHGCIQKNHRHTLPYIEEAAKKELTSGRGPTGIAAASIYIASSLCGEKRTQAKVAEAAGVTEVTIRNRYKELAERLEIDIETP